MVEFVRRGICTLVVIVVALLSAASQASARTVPQGFYGVNYSGNVEVLPFGTQSQLWNRLATGGAESARLLFNWDIAEKTQGNYNWSRIDSLVLAASQRRMKILATVEYAPPWAKLYPGQVASPPRSPSDYAGFLKQLIKRYGANGDFWKGPDLLHPHRTDIPYNPVEEWAIWNEPEIGFHWYRGRKHPWGKREARHGRAVDQRPPEPPALLRLDQHQGQVRHLGAPGLRREGDVHTHPADQLPQRAEPQRRDKRPALRHGDDVAGGEGPREPGLREHRLHEGLHNRQAGRS
jgi:hypothetical protein